MSNEIDIYNPQTMSSMMKVAEQFSKSNLVPKHFQNKPADILIALQQGSEMGMKPIQALNSIIVIQGSPSLKAEAQLAQVRHFFPSAYIKIEEDFAKQEVKCTMGRDRNYPDEYCAAIWNDAKASSMQLLGKDNYKKQKMTMYKWRAITEARRIVFPDICSGVYSPEEIADQNNKDFLKLTPEGDIRSDEIDEKSKKEFEQVKLMLAFITDGEVKLLKHLSTKFQREIENLEDIRLEEITYSANFLPQHLPEGKTLADLESEVIDV
jgi:hypothetical protein